VHKGGGGEQQADAGWLGSSSAPEPLLAAAQQRLQAEAREACGRLHLAILDSTQHGQQGQHTENTFVAFCYLEWYRRQKEQEAKGEDQPFWQRLRTHDLRERLRQQVLRIDLEEALRLARTGDGQQLLTAVLERLCDGGRRRGAEGVAGGGEPGLQLLQAGPAPAARAAGQQPAEPRQQRGAAGGGVCER
jgi:hypothetical protein